MNLYLISQKVNNHYDTYDSAVIVAECEDQARHIHPDGSKFWGDPKCSDVNEGWGSTWAFRLDEVKVEYLGIYKSERPSHPVICSSFNAG